MNDRTEWHIGPLKDHPAALEAPAGSRVTPERTADLVSIAAGAGTIPDAVALANLYSDEAVRYTQKLQAGEADEINGFLKQQLAQMDKDLAALNQQWRAAPRAALHAAG